MLEMVSEIKINNSVLKYRKTAWDKKVFDVNTVEILDVDSNCNDDVSLMLSDLEKITKGSGLIYYRVDANDFSMKEALTSNGYYVVESSLSMRNAKIQLTDFDKVFKNKLELKTEANDKDILDIKEIARTAFKYSRFHEDPFLDPEKCSMRYENWINDLISQNKKLLIHKKNNRVLSFMFYDESEDLCVNLILGGSRVGFGQLTPFFWSSVLMYLKSNKIKKINVVVSAANITIVNIYIMFGFFVSNSTLDFHKIIRS